jgi:NAD(P)-dependent dehydrogenase (short-subunit alcohol dehydrogenase family)
VDRLAVVAGGSGVIGFAVANRLKQDGYQPLLGDLIAPPDRRFAWSTLDVTSEDSVHEFLAVAQRTGSISAVVNTVGEPCPGAIDTIGLPDWNRTLAINLTGAFLISKAFLPELRKSAGALVHISSTSGIVGEPYHSAYSAAKHGLIGLVKALAAEHRGSSVRISVVCPGPVDTPLLKRALDRFAALRGVSTEDFPATLSAGRLAKPEEVADAIAFLVGNGYSNGLVLPLVGGVLRI